jgi:hypothetical protein
VDAGHGRGNLTLGDQLRLLLADLIRLKQMEFFAKAFITRARDDAAETTGKSQRCRF